MRLLSVILCAWLLAAPAAYAATAIQATVQQPAPGDFVPMDEARPGEQIPALPLIATAYGFIWVVLLGYVWSIGRRLQKVEGELAELESRKR
jgi:CcmD family protein